jgi:hypothetical protein
VEIFRVSEDQEVGRKMAINIDRVVVKKPAVFKEMVCSANVSLSFCACNMYTIHAMACW